jgi:sorbitol-specific phosphotransferase system component IIC
MRFSQLSLVKKEFYFYEKGKEVSMSLKHVNYRSATAAGIAGVILMVIVMALFGMNVLAGMGAMVGATGAGAYVAGIILHLIFGVIYALIYVLCVEKLLRSLPRGLAGATYSLFPFIMALLFMAPFAQSMQTVLKSAGSECYEEGCSSGCDMHKKMPYTSPSEKMGSTMMCRSGSGMMCSAGLMTCLGSFLGYLVYGIRSKARKERTRAAKVSGK